MTKTKPRFILENNVKVYTSCWFPAFELQTLKSVGTRQADHDQNAKKKFIVEEIVQVRECDWGNAMKDYKSLSEQVWFVPPCLTYRHTHTHRQTDIFWPVILFAQSAVLETDYYETYLDRPVLAWQCQYKSQQGMVKSRDWSAEIKS